MQSLLSLVVGLFLPFLASAGAFNQFQPATSHVGFISRQMGVPVEGVFKKIDAKISFDPARTTLSKVNLSIDLASIDTGSQEANEEVVSKNWFNVKMYPLATFISTAITAIDNTHFEVRGHMTIKGKTRDVVVPVVLSQSGNRAVFDGTFILKRLEYGLGEGPWGDVTTVANDVQIKCHIVLVRT